MASMHRKKSQYIAKRSTNGFNGERPRKAIRNLPRVHTPTVPMKESLQSIRRVARIRLRPKSRSSNGKRANAYFLVTLTLAPDHLDNVFLTNAIPARPIAAPIIGPKDKKTSPRQRRGPERNKTGSAAGEVTKVRHLIVEDGRLVQVGLRAAQKDPSFDSLFTRLNRRLPCALSVIAAKEFTYCQRRWETVLRMSAMP